jgi:hypothetical protein
MTWICGLLSSPSPARRKASQRPSGEKRGQKSLGPLVKRLGAAEPSVGIVQMPLR